MIDNGAELFGDHTLLPDGKIASNGFEALKFYDLPENGGNADRFIDASDLIYRRLLLWRDSNHDGVSQSSELHALAQSGIAKMSLKYIEQRKRDEYGNEFRFRAKLYKYSKNGAEIHPYNDALWDVFLVPAIRASATARQFDRSNKASPRGTFGSFFRVTPDFWMESNLKLVELATLMVLSYQRWSLPFLTQNSRILVYGSSSVARLSGSAASYRAIHLLTGRDQTCQY